MTTVPDSSTPSALNFKHSPLDRLVRHTSSRGAKILVPPAHGFSERSYNQPSYTRLPYSNTQVIPPRQIQQQPHQQSMHSFPLLHSHFARNSTATASSNDDNSYLDLSRASTDSRSIYQEFEGRYYDGESVYSDMPDIPALRDSWQSGSTVHAIRPSKIRDEPGADDLDAYPPTPLALSHPSVPTVIVSSEDVGEADRPTHAGKAPIILPGRTNFSRPARWAMTTPALPPDKQKQEVLERNSQHPSLPSLHSQSNWPLRNQHLQPEIEASQSSLSPASSLRTRSTSLVNSTRSRTPSPNSSRTPSPIPSSGPTQLVPPSSETAIMTSTPHFSPLSIRRTSRSTIALPRRPPSLRPNSPASLYSMYSYYQLDSASPSPSSEVPQFSQLSGSSRHPETAKQNPVTVTSSFTSSLHTPQEYLQMGIQHHEANRLKESAICFEESAKVQGGCGIGMLMWGLTLRHGWGCEKNEKIGFKWLRKAAESAVEDLESAGKEGRVDFDVVESELVIAIYEVGQCFFHGWGVPRDQKMAVSYYSVAARLGDPDAQNDLAFCLANGKGCKKDRKEAAMWYRAAVAQGQSDIGLAWIYKEKYQ